MLVVVKERLAHVVEDGVAGVGDTGLKRHRAVAGMQPAVLTPGFTQAGPIARAVGRLARSVGAKLKTCQGRKRLDSRSRHVLAADGAVEQRMRSFVIVELGPHVVGDAADKHRRVELGLARHTQNLAVIGIEAHHGTVTGVAVARGLGKLDGATQRRLASLLNLKVEREFNIRAGLGRNSAGLTDHVARGINLDGLLAADTLQQVLVVALDTRLAHDIARLVRNLTGRSVVVARGLLVLRLKLLGGNGAGVAQDVAGGLAIRILTLGALGDLHARKLTGMLLDIGDRGASHIGGDGV